MKVIISIVFVLVFFVQLNAQTKPEKKFELPPEGLKFFNGDSLKTLPDSMIVRVAPFNQMDSKMPEYIANPDVDYKMKIFKADSTIDYKILKKRY